MKFAKILMTLALGVGCGLTSCHDGMDENEVRPYPDRQYDSYEGPGFVAGKSGLVFFLSDYDNTAGCYGVIDKIHYSEKKYSFVIPDKIEYKGKKYVVDKIYGVIETRH